VAERQARAVPAGAFLDGASCVLLARLLAPAVRQLGAGVELDELRQVLITIGQAAEDQRAADAARLTPAPDGWLTSAEAARVLGVSERAITKRCALGRLPALRQGRRWRVDASALAG
jgi:excisionase family DNA binding protein